MLSEHSKVALARGPRPEPGAITRRAEETPGPDGDLVGLEPRHQRELQHLTSERKAIPYRVGRNQRMLVSFGPSHDRVLYRATFYYGREPAQADDDDVRMVGMEISCADNPMLHTVFAFSPDHTLTILAPGTPSVRTLIPESAKQFGVEDGREFIAVSATIAMMDGWIEFWAGETLLFSTRLPEAAVAAPKTAHLRMTGGVLGIVTGVTWKRIGAPVQPEVPRAGDF